MRWIIKQNQMYGQFSYPLVGHFLFKSLDVLVIHLHFVNQLRQFLF